MPQFRVYQVQEEVIVHKMIFVINADDEDDAIEKAMNGEFEPTEQSTADDAGYMTWGWSSRLADAPDEGAWDEAIKDLEERRLV
jgi:hypothetical protein